MIMVGACIGKLLGITSEHQLKQNIVDCLVSLQVIMEDNQLKWRTLYFRFIDFKETFDITGLKHYKKKLIKISWACIDKLIGNIAERQLKEWAEQQKQENRLPAQTPNHWLSCLSAGHNGGQSA